MTTGTAAGDKNFPPTVPGGIAYKPPKTRTARDGKTYPLREGMGRHFGLIKPGSIRIDSDAEFALIDDSNSIKTVITTYASHSDLHWTVVAEVRREPARQGRNAPRALRAEQKLHDIHHSVAEYDRTYDSGHNAPSSWAGPLGFPICHSAVRHSDYGVSVQKCPLHQGMVGVTVPG